MVFKTSKYVPPDAYGWMQSNHRRIFVKILEKVSMYPTKRRHAIGGRVFIFCYNAVEVEYDPKKYRPVQDWLGRSERIYVRR